MNRRRFLAASAYSTAAATLPLQTVQEPPPAPVRSAVAESPATPTPPRSATW
ncbi:hypothetical protein ACFTWD_04970 [Streptomyces sp. NPDC056943]|uniref:hypothetical protein n=1 Tax=Streptomyces sp. NPDC056943 TaxID=3345971 RepID=UPI0036297F0F